MKVFVHFSVYSLEITQFNCVVYGGLAQYETSNSDHQACMCIEQVIEYAESARSFAELDHFEEIFVGKNPECTDAFMEESDDLIDSICPSLKEEVMKASKEAALRLNWEHPELRER